jgi:lysozyme
MFFRPAALLVFAALLSTHAAAAAQKRVAASTLKTNAEGLAIIEAAEGLRLTAYTDGKQWYIGYGHAGANKGQTITKQQAEAYLKQDLTACENAIAKAVTVPVTSNEFSAMASLCHNLGTGGYSRSSVVTKLNAKDRKGAADAFLNHDKATVNGVKKALPQLTERRKKERALFLKK